MAGRNGSGVDEAIKEWGSVFTHKAEELVGEAEGFCATIGVDGGSDLGDDFVDGRKFGGVEVGSTFGVHVGANRARADALGGYVSGAGMGNKFDLQVADKAVECGFGGAVDGIVWGGQVGGGGADKDDFAAIFAGGFLELGQQGVGEGDGCAQVDVDELVDAVGGLILNGADVACTCVVDEQIDVADVLLG